MSTQPRLSNISHYFQLLKYKRSLLYIEN
ncbi:hypothetical protein RHECNPAF_7500114 [Rhizobium etli CNPAF512]|nr:hypothetical protein RHECNPAF_7500114 [Rhizobium etli CNPAF512]